MKQAQKSTQNKKTEEIVIAHNNERDCPSCGLKTLEGMPGGRDAICSNCGYKDPCCYD